MYRIGRGLSPLLRGGLRIPQRHALLASPITGDRRYSTVSNDNSTHNTLNYDGVTLDSLETATKASASTLPHHVVSADGDGFIILTAIQKIFEIGHDYGHLPWWLDIAVVAVAVRTALMLPVAVYQARMYARMENLRPMLTEYMEALKHSVATKCRRENKSYEEFAKTLNGEFKAKRKEVFQLHNCHPYRAILAPLVQIPIWISLSLALRRMAGTPVLGYGSAGDHVPGFDTGGCLWFHDLTAADSTMILPGLLCLTQLVSVELNTLKVVEQDAKNRILTNVFRGLAVMMVPIASQVPAGMVFYWTVSGLYGLGQNFAMRQPAVRRAFNVAETPSERVTLWRALQNKWEAERNETSADTGPPDLSAFAKKPEVRPLNATEKLLAKQLAMDASRRMGRRIDATPTKAVGGASPTASNPPTRPPSPAS